MFQQLCYYYPASFSFSFGLFRLRAVADRFACHLSSEGSGQLLSSSRSKTMPPFEFAVTEQSDYCPFFLFSFFLFLFFFAVDPHSGSGWILGRRLANNRFLHWTIWIAFSVQQFRCRQYHSLRHYTFSGLCNHLLEGIWTPNSKNDLQFFCHSGTTHNSCWLIAPIECYLQFICVRVGLQSIISAIKRGVAIPQPHEESRFDFLFLFFLMRSAGSSSAEEKLAGPWLRSLLRVHSSHII